MRGPCAQTRLGLFVGSNPFPLIQVQEIVDWINGVVATFDDIDLRAD